MELPSWFGMACALSSSLTWAIGSGFYARLTEKHSAATVNFSRASIAFPLFLMTGLLTAPHALTSGVPAPTVGWALVSVLSSYGIGDVCFFMSAIAIGVPSAMAIGSTYPLLSALAAVALRGETLTPHRALGILLTVAGTILVILAAGKKPTATPVETPSASEQRKHILSRRTGVGLAFLTSFCWCLNAIAVAEAGRTLHSAWVNVLRMGIALILCPVVGLLLARFTGAKAPRRPWIGGKDYVRSIWVFALEGYGGALLFTYGLTHSPLSVGPALSALAPVFAVPVAWIHGREKLFSPRTLGVLLVVAGLCLL
jgi:drug/metabolite transporter (DMT)-like permease